MQVDKSRKAPLPCKLRDFSSVTERLRKDVRELSVACRFMAGRSTRPWNGGRTIHCLPLVESQPAPCSSPELNHASQQEYHASLSRSFHRQEHVGSSQPWCKRARFSPGVPARHPLKNAHRSGGVMVSSIECVTEGHGSAIVETAIRLGMTDVAKPMRLLAYRVKKSLRYASLICTVLSPCLLSGCAWTV